jgi:hypothetical protein
LTFLFPNNIKNQKSYSLNKFSELKFLKNNKKSQTDQNFDEIFRDIDILISMSTILLTDTIANLNVEIDS